MASIKLRLFAVTSAVGFGVVLSAGCGGGGSSTPPSSSPTPPTSKYYSISDLGQSFDILYPLKINDLGNVCGQDHRYQVAMANVNSVSYHLASIGGAHSAAMAINNNNAMTGWGDLSTAGEEDIAWFQGSTASDAGSLGFWNNTAGFPKAVRGTGINDSGDIVGVAIDSSLKDHAVIHTGLFTSDLGIAGDSSFAMDINNNRQITGGAFDSTGESAFLYPLGGPVTFIGPGYGAAINNLGDVAIVNGAGSSLYKGGVSTPIPLLAGATSMVAADINDDDVVVGLVDIPGGNTRGFIFANGVTKNMNALIDPASGWGIISASSINKPGQIVGFAMYKGQRHAYLLTPPPTT